MKKAGKASSMASDKKTTPTIVRSGQPTTLQKHAGFWIRLAARLIDATILYGLLMLLYLPFALFYAVQGKEVPDGPPLLFIILAIMWMLLYIMYDIYFIKKRQATPGKIICEIKVIKEDGSAINWGDSIARWLVFKLGTSIFTLFLGSLWIIWDEKKQGWHDKACGTVVVHK